MTIDPVPVLVCAICLYVNDDDGSGQDALTVIEGYAVCEDHMAYVAQGENFASILRAARRELGVGD